MQIDFGFKGIFKEIPGWREQGFVRAHTLHSLTKVSRLSEPSQGLCGIWPDPVMFDLFACPKISKKLTGFHADCFGRRIRLFAFVKLALRLYHLI